MPAKTTRLVCGMLHTKDVRGFLRALRSAADRLYGIAVPGEESSLPAARVAATASELGFSAEASPTAEAAVSRISAERPDCRILVCGSLYLAGAVLQENS